MLDLDKWQEILDTIRKNKLRTFLTGFSVAWGIFMLIILLGSGQALENGVEYEMRDDAVNSVWVFPGQTSIPYQGMKPGRRVRFTNLDHEDIATGVDGVEHITSRFYVGTVTVARGREHGEYDIRAVHPGHRHLEKTIITQGRYLNELDQRRHRKTAVIGDLVAKALFRGAPSLGEEIRIRGISFQVVGLFEDVGSESEMEKVYIPISTAQRAFGGANRVHHIMFTTGDASLEETQAMTASVGKRLSANHKYDPADRRAVFIRNNNQEYYRFVGLMTGIRLFIWVVGIGTILAGVVGVSNIMLIAVRERTREIGIRKALGATPWSIVDLILQEAILITTVAGYTGMVLGVAVLELVSVYLPEGTIFRNPGVDIRIAVYATLLLVVAGTVAGFFPARKAAAVRPMQALREE